MTENKKITLAERLIGSTRDMLCEALDMEGISRTELASRAGMLKAEISQILNGSRNMSLKTLARLADGLGYDVTVKLARRPTPLDLRRDPFFPPTFQSEEVADNGDER